MAQAPHDPSGSTFAARTALIYGGAKGIGRAVAEEFARRGADVIVADLNGVVVVPRDISDDLLMRLDSKAAKESDYVTAVARGDFNNDWVDTMLEASGVEVRQPAKH